MAGKADGQLTRRIQEAEQGLRDGRSAFHARIECLEQGGRLHEHAR